MPNMHDVGDSVLLSLKGGPKQRWHSLAGIDYFPTRFGMPFRAYRPKIGIAVAKTAYCLHLTQRLPLRFDVFS